MASQASSEPMSPRDMASSAGFSTSLVVTVNKVSPSLMVWKGWMACVMALWTWRPSCWSAPVSSRWLVTSSVMVVLPGGVGGPFGRVQAAFDGGQGMMALAGAGIQVAADDLSGAINDGADGVDDGEQGELGRPQLPEGAALAGQLAVGEADPLAHRGGGSGAARAQGKLPTAGRPERGAAQRLVGIDGVLAGEVVDDRGADAGNGGERNGVLALGE